MKELLTYRDLANHLKFKEQTVRKWVSTGRIPDLLVERFGRSVRFRADNIELIKVALCQKNQ